MNLKPLHDWAVVRPSEAEEVTAGGLYIPETAKTKPQEGVVEAIGPGAYEEEKGHRKKEKKKKRRFVPTTIKPGDRVLYERYAGRTFTFDGEERILVRERDILGILGDRSSRPKPLLIPAATSTAGPTALVKRAPAERAAPVKKKAVKKTKKKVSAKSSPVKKAGKKIVAKKGNAVKKAAVKKGPKATVKKATARKTKKKK